MVASVAGLLQNILQGRALLAGDDFQTLFNLLFSTKSGLTALAGGGQVGATVLPAAINEVSTVATTADSVQLPPAIPGLQIEVSNHGVNSMQVFGNPANANNGNASDTIIANNSSTPAAAATGVAHAANKVAYYSCIKAGVWKQLLSN